ncbi:MAG: C40 family peptidase [Chroococcidiopsidaceae cyanobacterium CP_BM_RX_35]|nr:C40 family peptidase [Chroococcidiopsidaceae cyanobacterium CP_BM_RX_35]
MDIVEPCEHRCLADLNLYDSSYCTRLATQAAAGRHLRVNSLEQVAAEVCLCEDEYSGWLLLQDLSRLQPVEMPYQVIALSEAEIRTRIATVISFAKAAMQQPNCYLWGGTVGPNYDCSGLMQAAFASIGIWLPRDAYQQEAFTQAVAIEAMIPGDLVFFGIAEKATHVGLYLGAGYYIHSSGQDVGRNGIGIDQLSTQGDAVSRLYYQQLRRAGRVVRSYEPSGFAVVYGGKPSCSADSPQRRGDRRGGEVI